MRHLKTHSFIISLLGAVILAFVYPSLGSPEGPLQTGLLTKLGIMIIFFLQGLSLKTGELTHGFRNVKLHLFIQGWIFLFSPVILIGAGLLLRGVIPSSLSDGFIYLSLIPTTVSSAVAFTSSSNGNVAAAIFNTTLSNVLGVFWVPVGCLLLFATGGGPQGGLIGDLLFKLSLLILLPLIVGQVLRPFVVERRGYKAIAPSFKRINNGIILFIVYTAFCRSALSGTWQTVGAADVVILLATAAVCVILIHAGVWISSGWLFGEQRDRKAALFCGAQKTLAAGAPIAMAVFASNELASVNLGFILMPLLCYHPMQLFLAAMLLPKLED